MQLAVRNFLSPRKQGHPTTNVRVPMVHISSPALHMYKAFCKEPNVSSFSTRYCKAICNENYYYPGITVWRRVCFEAFINECLYVTHIYTENGIKQVEFCLQFFSVFSLMSY